MSTHPKETRTANLWKLILPGFFCICNHRAQNKSKQAKLKTVSKANAMLHHVETVHSPRKAMASDEVTKRFFRNAKFSRRFAMGKIDAGLELLACAVAEGAPAVFDDCFSGSLKTYKEVSVEKWGPTLVKCLEVKLAKTREMYGDEDIDLDLYKRVLEHLQKVPMFAVVEAAAAEAAATAAHAEAASATTSALKRLVAGMKQQAEKERCRALELQQQALNVSGFEEAIKKLIGKTLAEIQMGLKFPGGRDNDFDLSARGWEGYGREVNVTVEWDYSPLHHAYKACLKGIATACGMKVYVSDEQAIFSAE